MTAAVACERWRIRLLAVPRKLLLNEPAQIAALMIESRDRCLQLPLLRRRRSATSPIHLRRHLAARLWVFCCCCLVCASNLIGSRDKHRRLQHLGTERAAAERERAAAQSRESGENPSQRGKPAENDFALTQREVSVCALVFSVALRWAEARMLRRPRGVAF
jgi:hypothetical protein